MVQGEQALGYCKALLVRQLWRETWLRDAAACMSWGQGGRSMVACCFKRSGGSVTGGGTGE
jgi:hypothetical protein